MLQSPCRQKCAVHLRNRTECLSVMQWRRSWGAAFGRLFIGVRCRFMDIFVYSDESGVFDVAHNNWFVFGGLIFLSKKSADEASRRYIHAERCLSLPDNFDRSMELKAVNLTNRNKGHLFRSLNGAYRFGCVIDQRRVLKQIFQAKKSRQRYLDYAYKIAVKRAFEKMIQESVIKAENVRRISFLLTNIPRQQTGDMNFMKRLNKSSRLAHITGVMTYFIRLFSRNFPVSALNFAIPPQKPLSAPPILSQISSTILPS